MNGKMLPDKVISQNALKSNISICDFLWNVTTS